MMRKLKADILVIGCVLFIALLFLVIPALTESAGPSFVVIKQEGVQEQYHSLLEDGTIMIRATNGGYNLILINDGSVRVTDADCPDKLCVKQKQISKNGESIICLPHKLVVQVVSKEESGMDAMTN